MVGASLSFCFVAKICHNTPIRWYGQPLVVCHSLGTRVRIGIDQENQRRERVPQLIDRLGYQVGHK